MLFSREKELELGNLNIITDYLVNDFNDGVTAVAKSNLFRRDEIKFVERNDENHCSIHYSLSNFGTAGEKGVRKNEDYMKNYFVDRYGAIRDVDFTHIFKNFIENKKEV